MQDSTTEKGRRGEFARRMFPRAWRAFWRTLLFQSHWFHAVILLLLLVGGFAANIVGAAHGLKDLGILGNVVLGVVVLWALFTGAYEAWLESEEVGKAEADSAKAAMEKAAGDLENLTEKLRRSEEETRREREQHRLFVASPAQQAARLKQELRPLAEEALRRVPSEEAQKGIRRFVALFDAALDVIRRRAPNHAEEFTFDAQHGINHSPGQRDQVDIGRWRREATASSETGHVMGAEYTYFARLIKHWSAKIEPDWFLPEDSAGASDALVP